MACLHPVLCPEGSMGPPVRSENKEKEPKPKTANSNVPEDEYICIENYDNNTGKLYCYEIKKLK